MKKNLFEELRKGICQNLTQKILLVFAFLFFRPVFSQLYVENPAVLTVKDDAFISQSDENDNITIFNNETLGNKNVNKVDSTVSANSKPNLLAQKSILKKNKKKASQDNTEKKELTNKIISGNRKHNIFFSLVQYNSSSIITPVYGAAIPTCLSEGKLNLNKFPFKNIVFYIENEYVSTKTFGFSVRPPPV